MSDSTNGRKTWRASSVASYIIHYLYFSHPLLSFSDSHIYSVESTVDCFLVRTRENEESGSFKKNEEGWGHAAVLGERKFFLKILQNINQKANFCDFSQTSDKRRRRRRERERKNRKRSFLANLPSLNWKLLNCRHLFSSNSFRSFFTSHALATSTELSQLFN